MRHPGERSSEVIQLPDTPVQTMEDFFMWTFSPQPQIDERATFSEVVRLGIFAWRYQISALSNQVTDMIRSNLANGDWQLQASMVHDIYEATPTGSSLREVIRAALGQLPRSNVEGEGQSREQWKATFLKHAQLGWDYIEAGGSEWTPQDYLSGVCRFHDHQEVSLQEESLALCDGCVYAREDCYPRWEQQSMKGLKDEEPERCGADKEMIGKEGELSIEAVINEVERPVTSEAVVDEMNGTIASEEVIDEVNGTVVLEKVIHEINGTVTAEGVVDGVNGMIASDAVINEVNGTVASEEVVNEVNGTMASEAVADEVNGTVALEAVVDKMNGTVTSEAVADKVNGTVASEEMINEVNGTVASEEMIDEVNGTVPSEEVINEANGTVASEEVVNEVNGSVASEAVADEVNGTVASEEVVNEVNGTVASKAVADEVNGTVALEAVVDKMNGTVTSEAVADKVNGTVTSGSVVDEVDGTVAMEAVGIIPEERVGETMIETATMEAKSPKTGGKKGKKKRAGR